MKTRSQLSRTLLRRFGIFGIVAMALIVACASFEGPIPVNTGMPELTHISPRNMDGVQDDIRISLDIPELKGLTLAGYEIAVVNESGLEVYSTGRAEQRPAGIRRFFSRPKAVELPPEFTWNGVDFRGDWVPDGPYTITAEAWDYKDNRGSSPALRVIVDNQAPHVDVSAPYLVFSPNGDGRQDTLDIFHTNASTEDLWAGAILDANGRQVREFTWTGTPGTLEWDGRTANGAAAAEGQYSYLLRSTDRAGNSFETRLVGIQLDMSVYPISLSVNPRAFSPNADGVQDTVRFTLSAEGREEIAEITLKVIDTAGTPRRSFTPTEIATGAVVFDGRADNGQRLPEGEYYGLLEVTYRNGARPSLTSERFVLDVTSPQASVRAGLPVFSPDGDGRKDSVVIIQSSEMQPEWRGRINDARGRLVREFTWQGQVANMEWDGTDATGNIVPDGSYSYTLVATDAAGNRGAHSIPRIVVDTRATPVRVVPSRSTFNPSAGGLDAIVEFQLRPEVTDGVESWEFAVLDSAGEAVMQHFGETSTVPETIAWNGTAPDGSVTEGVYSGQLSVVYLKGNVGAAVSDTPVLLDMSPPDVNVRLSPLPFSPDGDGINDTLNIQVRVEDPSGVKSWSAEILDPAGNRFLSLPQTRFRNGSFVWDGKSATGELVQSASDYTVVVVAEDQLGNAGRSEFVIPTDILVLRDGDRLRISISSIYFRPFTADYLGVEADVRERNVATLDRLAEILKRYPNHRIELEGHAVRVLWNQPGRWELEERDTLLPLSRLRAEAVRTALVQRGIASARMTTSGKGGYEPIVEHSDAMNRWKNRRVEFYLLDN